MNPGLRQRARPRGYTLVELMIVVAIIAILAAIGAYSILKYLNASRTSEAVEFINTVRAAQETYKDETFKYLNVTDDISAVFPFTNEAELKKQSKGWDAGASGVLKKFDELGVRASGRVQFGYSCIAANGTEKALPGKAALRVATSPLPAAPRGWWYVVRAIADRDGDGQVAALVGSSFSDQVYVELDTE